MVSTFEHSSSQPTALKRSDLQLYQQNSSLTFPLSSPHQETLTTFKPINGGSKLVPGDAFLSSNPFASSSSDDDSGSSSGQDEFHLERYSQDANRPKQSSRPNRKHSSRRKQQRLPQSRADKKPRPGLNIVTNFSSQAKRSKSDGLIVDQVQSQRPQLGPRFATSIMSAKAEPMDHSFFEPHSESGVRGTSNEKAHVSKRALARQAVSRLQESPAARRKAAELSRTQKTAPSEVQSTASKEQLQEPVSTTSGYSPGARSIVIGMSVPEHEVDSHQSAGGNNIHSANTPDTPAIVITPAEESDAWKPPFFNTGRPASSVYSSHTRTEMQIHHDKLPPVPRIPPRHAQHDNSIQPGTGATFIRPSQAEHGNLEELDSDDEKDRELLDDGPRNSSESQQRILPSDVESRRHKSQGWWNLMLSPMLSRKGTIVDKGNRGSPDTPPVPAIPADVRLSKTDVVSPLDSESPETPRRLGLASARASVWSRWTTWERQRDGNTRPSPTSVTDLDAEQPRDMVRDSSQVPSFPTFDTSKGLAAEYYHACAVEQLTGIPYFECEGHSCAEKLPQLQSIFDKEGPIEPIPGADASKSSGDEAPIHAGDTDEANLVVPTMPESEVKRGISFRSEPEQLSPNVRQADTAAVVKARAIETPELAHDLGGEHESEGTTARAGADSTPKERSIPTTETPRHEPQYANITTVAPSNLQPPILSPGPVSPAMQRSMTSEGAVPMTQIEHYPSRPRLLEHTPASSEQQAFGVVPPPSVTIHNHTLYSDRSPFGDDAAIGEARKEAMERLESATTTHEADQPPRAVRKEFPAPKDAEPVEKKEKRSFLSKLKSLLRLGKAAPSNEPNKKRRRWTLIISVAMFLIVLACILLATLLTRAGDGTPVQSQWLNLTGYPPMPTGISTIGRPDIVKQQSKCVAPNTMWSCALPKEDQFEVAPNSPDQPNFRFQITFRNGTVPANKTIPVQDLEKRSTYNPSKRADDPFTNDLFTPNPPPPSRADQIFLGNTTDNITQPFQGEQTPFFITFIPVFPIDPSNATATTSSATGSKLRARQSSNSSNDIIPDPDVLDDGSAAPANLLPTDPYPFSQPIQLYNRGQQDEHYGFYMYYDKAVFLRSTAALNTSEFADNGGIDPEDSNGGSTRDESRLRCTFSQTRFLVRMWTNSAFGATLLAPISNGTNGTNPKDNNSATDFDRPGSFPYPTSISIDRHGGNINKKAVFCYGVDALQVIQNDVKTIVPELRNAGGTLTNPAPALVNGTVGDDSGFDQEAGGIDGGFGGCECVWQNWN